MKNNLRVAFMGTPEFALASLRALLESGHSVVVVVTAPDRPAGRGRKLRPSAVKVFAQQHGIPVLQPEKLKDPDFLSALKKYEADVQVVVAFRMLPRVVWAMPASGTFNLHASLLPDYRGAAPINWALINGETQSGVTTFFIDEKIDTGNIILQKTLGIGPDETAGELHDRLMEQGAGAVVETVGLIKAGTVTTRRQKHLDSAKNAPKLTRENCRLQWNSPHMEVFNKIRGLSPYPGAWTLLVNDLEQVSVKIFRAIPADISQNGKPGQLKVEDKRLFSATAEGWLEIQELQLPGKKRMHAKEVLNGLKIQKNACFL